MLASDLESREKIVLLSNRDHGSAWVDRLRKHFPGQLLAGDPLIFVLSEDDMRHLTEEVSRIRGMIDMERPRQSGCGAAVGQCLFMTEAGRSFVIEKFRTEYSRLGPHPSLRQVAERQCR
jgi:hypothetical protein